jgi:hypothetical protein
MKTHWRAITAFAWVICLSSCASASFEDRVAGNGDVQLTGWARLAGEFIIYSDTESMNQKLKFPHCISGVFSDQYGRKDRSEHNGHLVTVTGTLFKYSDLPEEDRPAIPRKVLGDSVVPNWCFGPNVLLIKSMKNLRT